MDDQVTDPFTEAFRGRFENAMRWHQLGELGKAEYRAIVKAAEDEARRPLENGAVRLKWCDGVEIAVPRQKIE